MRRFHSSREQAIMFRRWKMEMEQHGYDWRNPPTDPAACHCAKGIGSMRKRAPLDCGKTRCAMCHWGKWDKKARARKLREILEYELFAEGWSDRLHRTKRHYSD